MKIHIEYEYNRLLSEKIDCKMASEWNIIRLACDVAGDSVCCSTRTMETVSLTRRTDRTSRLATMSSSRLQRQPSAHVSWFDERLQTHKNVVLYFSCCRLPAGILRICDQARYSFYCLSHFKNVYDDDDECRRILILHVDCVCMPSLSGFFFRFHFHSFLASSAAKCKAAQTTKVPLMWGFTWGFPRLWVWDCDKSSRVRVDSMEIFEWMWD